MTISQVQYQSSMQFSFSFQADIVSGGTAAGATATSNASTTAPSSLGSTSSSPTDEMSAYVSFSEVAISLQQSDAAQQSNSVQQSDSLQWSASLQQSDALNGTVNTASQEDPAWAFIQLLLDAISGQPIQLNDPAYATANTGANTGAATTSTSLSFSETVVSSLAEVTANDAQSSPTVGNQQQSIASNH